jgi:polyferredoxin
MRMKSVRLTSQMFFFIFSAIGVFGVAMTGIFYPFYYCYAGPQAVGLCPLGILQHGFIQYRINDVAGALALLAYLFGFFGIMSVILGRAVCGWACPVGFIQEFFAWPGEGRTGGFGDGMDTKEKKRRLPVGGLVLLLTGVAALAWAFAAPELSLLTVVIGAVLSGSGLGVLLRPRIVGPALHWDRPRHEPALGDGWGKYPNAGRNGLIFGAALLVGGFLLTFYRLRFAVEGDVGQFGEKAEDAWAALGLGLAVAGGLLMVAFTLGGSRMRYALLLLIPLTSWWSGATLYTDLDPVGMITGTIPFLIENDEGWVAGDFFAAKVTLTALFFLSAAFVSRFWCRFICPLGAMMSPFNRISVLHLRLDKSACIKCRECEDVCPTRVPILPRGMVRGESGDVAVRDDRCILCGRCADVCPTRAISLDMGGKRWRGKGRPKKGKSAAAGRAGAGEITKGDGGEAGA